LGAGPKDIKRSNSLFDNPKKQGPKRTVTMDMSRKKNSKITDNDSDEDGAPPDKQKVSYMPGKR
jgi:hypothetical protein